jgi:hypothetical protein
MIAYHVSLFLAHLSFTHGKKGGEIPTLKACKSCDHGFVFVFPFTYSISFYPSGYFFYFYHSSSFSVRINQKHSTALFYKPFRGEPGDDVFIIFIFMNVFCLFFLFLLRCMLNFFPQHRILQSDDEKIGNNASTHSSV